MSYAKAQRRFRQEALDTLYQAKASVPDHPTPEYATALALLEDATGQLNLRRDLSDGLRLLNSGLKALNSIVGRRQHFDALVPPQGPATFAQEWRRRWLTSRAARFGLVVAAAVAVIGCLAGVMLAGNRPAAAAPPASNMGYVGCPQNAIGGVPISSMKIGQVGYITGWTYFSQDGKVWVNPTYAVTGDMCGTSDVPIEHTARGYAIWPNPSNPVQPGSMSDFDGEANIKPASAYVAGHSNTSE